MTATTITATNPVGNSDNQSASAALTQGVYGKQRTPEKLKRERPAFYQTATPIMIGIAALLLLWWLGGQALASNPNLSSFADFAPTQALPAFWTILTDGSGWQAAYPSLGRVLAGMAWAIAIGAPVGLSIGYWPYLASITRVPFQLLRMISPLSWMPIAVLTFASWDGAIVFLIAAAAVWPIIFATAAGVQRIDPTWLIAGRSHGGKGWRLIRHIVIPAILPDLLSGIRIALGTAWIVLVPAEYLGVTSGLGYAINDARDTLSYDLLAAFILLIGVLGFLLDSLLALLLSHTQWTPSA